MPIFGIGLHILLAIFFAIHAVRNGRELYWLLILFMFPLLGSIVYGVAIWLPDMRNNRTLKTVGRGLQKVIDPQRRLREALSDFETTDTVKNRLTLADALLDSGRASEAVVHYQNALHGPFASEPDIHVRLAKALLESGQAATARDQLAELIQQHPEFKSELGHLAYARALADCAEQAKAREEFEVLINYHSSLEAPARYVEYLQRWNDRTHADHVRDLALNRAKRLPAHTRDAEREWLKQLQRQPN